MNAHRALRLTAIVFAAAVLVHNGDHLRRGGHSVTTDVMVIGSLGMLVEIGVVWAVLARKAFAPLVAVLAGAALSAGYVFVHLLPQRSWLSDSLLASHGHGVTWFTWVAVFGLLAASVLLALAGRRAMRADPGSPHRPTGSGGLHPVVIAMIVGNAIIFVGSLATR